MKKKALIAGILFFSWILAQIYYEGSVYKLFH